MGEEMRHRARKKHAEFRIVEYVEADGVNPKESLRKRREIFATPPSEREKKSKP